MQMVKKIKQQFEISSKQKSSLDSQNIEVQDKVLKKVKLSDSQFSSSDESILEYKSENQEQLQYKQKTYTNSDNITQFSKEAAKNSYRNQFENKFSLELKQVYEDDQILNKYLLEEQQKMELNSIYFLASKQILIIGVQGKFLNFYSLFPKLTLLKMIDIEKIQILNAEDQQPSNENINFLYTKIIFINSLTENLKIKDEDIVDAKGLEIAKKTVFFDCSTDLLAFCNFNTLYITDLQGKCKFFGQKFKKNTTINVLKVDRASQNIFVCFDNGNLVIFKYYINKFYNVDQDDLERSFQQTQNKKDQMNGLNNILQASQYDKKMQQKYYNKQIKQNKYYNGIRIDPMQKFALGSSIYSMEISQNGKYIILGYSNCYLEFLELDVLLKKGRKKSQLYQMDLEHEVSSICELPLINFKDKNYFYLQNLERNRQIHILEEEVKNQQNIENNFIQNDAKQQSENQKFEKQQLQVSSLDKQNQKIQQIEQNPQQNDNIQQNLNQIQSQESENQEIDEKQLLKQKRYQRKRETAKKNRIENYNKFKHLQEIQGDYIFTIFDNYYQIGYLDWKLIGNKNKEYMNKINKRLILSPYHQGYVPKRKQEICVIRDNLIAVFAHQHIYLQQVFYQQSTPLIQNKFSYKFKQMNKKSYAQGNMIAIQNCNKYYILILNGNSLFLYEVKTEKITKKFKAPTQDDLKE
ncbi:WD40-repeat-containing domain [Pseudocohnilembus persalinus]|uniref:WD40-repeat-containing domain n=1 Tax=Pseudocohnilembus persalinus TaxID=266149 RepID=A0A0V0QAI3_PSEPJ|nr:WD40-repeat-containing domain [Pseudocohnilembus persalinus]|eukprot:KRW99245.1 WD40-repeat-containing domain [Pseudocohnilembus persalinus]